MNKAELLEEIDALRYSFFMEPRSRLRTRRADLLAELAELKAKDGQISINRRAVVRPAKRPLRTRRFDRQDSTRVWEMFDYLKKMHQAAAFTPADTLNWNEFEKLLEKKFRRTK